MAVKTFPVSASLPVNLTGENNPGDLHLPLGRWHAGTGLTWATRVLLKAAISFSGMTAINEARIYLYQHTAAGWHAKGLNTATISARRKTADWSEASGGDSTATNETWGGSGDHLVESSYAAQASGDFANVTDAADGTLVAITITELVRAWHAGSPNYGILLINASSETDPDVAKEFYSRRTAGKVPYFWIDYSTNTPPNAPTNLSPTASAVRHTGRTITFSGSRSDPDSGDYITAYNIALYTDAGDFLGGNTPYETSGTPTTFSRAVTLPAGYNANAYYKWKARTRDRAGAWGPYSALQRFRPNTVPNTPTGLAVDTDTLTPTFSGGFSDPDAGSIVHTGDDLAAIEIEVTLNVSPYTSKWISGEIAKSGSTWSQVYGGSALAWSTTYRYRVRVKDALGGWSAFSAWISFTTTQPTGPDNLTPRSLTAKQNTLTPTLTVGHSAQFRNEQIEVRTSAGAGALLWSKAWDGVDYANTNTKARTYAGTALAWGGTYYWRAQVELTDGSVTGWSAWQPFYVNALPTAPTVTIESDSGAAFTRPSDGMTIVTDSTPVIRAPFSDPDQAQFGDAASARQVELRRADTLAAHTGYPKTTGTGDTDTVGTPLTADVTYEARVGFRDDAAQPAGTYVFSAWKQFRYSAAPTAALVAPPNGGAITDANPVLDWSFAGSGGKAQRSYRVEIFDKGPTGVPSYAQAVLALAPLVYYRMGDEAGPLVNSGSAAGLTATPNGGAVLAVPGLLTRDEDRAISFDGTDDWVQVTGVPALSGAFTLAAWIDTEVDKDEYVMSRGSQAYLRRTAAFDQIVMSWLDAGSVQQTFQSAIGSVPADGQPRFVVGVHSGTTVSIYINGGLSGSVGGQSLLAVPTGQWGIGANNAGGADFWNGVLDEAAMWATALTAQQIADLYASGTNPQNYPNEIGVLDSGVIISNATSFAVPIGVLQDDHDYRWQVTVEDTDGLTYVLT